MEKIKFNLSKQDIKEIADILYLYLNNKMDFNSKTQYERLSNFYCYLREIQYGRNKKKI